MPASALNPHRSEAAPMTEHETPPPAPADTPRITIKLEEAVAAAAMALICVITFANVLVRYFTDASFAFTEEFSVFLLVVLTLVGAAAAFARNRNIRVEFFADMTPPPVRRALEIGGLALTVLLFVMVAWYGGRFVADDWKYGTTSPGIGIPQWVYSLWLPVLALAIAGRALGRIMRLLRTPR
jgi:TRAP-type transport system small permease protein